MPKKPISKITITVDLEEIRKYAMESSRKNGGLESSSGFTPSNLDEVWDSVRSCLPTSEDKFVEVVSTVISILTGAHETYASEEGEGENADDTN